MSKMLVLLGLCTLVSIQTARAQTQQAAPAIAATAALVPVQDFFRAPQLIKPVLSPDGRYLAAAVAKDSSRLQLAVLDLQQMNSFKVVASFSDADVNNYQWVNNERLVLSVVDPQSADRPLAPGLWAVNRDGSDFRQLINANRGSARTIGSAIVDRMLPWEWRLHSTITDGSDDVMVQEIVFNSMREVVGSRLARLNTKTLQRQNLSVGVPDHVWHWLLDRQGEPAAVTTVFRGRVASYLKTGQGWQLWNEGDRYHGSHVQPFWIGPDKELLVLARRNADTTALYEVDRATLKLADQPTVSMPGYDFNGRLVYDAGVKRLLGVHFETDAHGSVWIDAGMRALQDEVDKLLPGTINRIDCTRCASSPVVLVSAVADRVPPVYLLYQRDTKQLRRIAASRPWIKPEQMGRRELLRFDARDGLSIPLLVTHPAGKVNGPRPAVVLVHGGPWVRGAHWDWEAQAQFLASRGYVVIEPEFRGSTGYGFKHFRAGWKQWGLAMQDDVADALQWAVKQGWVDAQRVCIAGASYGGYATLMGLIKHPSLYRCGVEWAGVSDIDLLYSISWSDASEEVTNYTLPVLVGDPEKDAQQLKHSSPLARAQELRQPLLMAYGGIDRRVPIKHGTAMRDALQQSNKSVEWIVYPNEGHGWRELETNADFWTRVEKFLDQHIGPGAAKPP